MNNNSETTENTESCRQSASAFRSISLEDYLQDVLDAIDDDNNKSSSPESYRMELNAQHRKKMIRCLLGYHKKPASEFNALLQTVQVQHQWELATKLIQDELAALDHVSESDAPHYRQGILQWQRQQQQDDDDDNHHPKLTNNTNTKVLRPSTNSYTPRKFLSSLARGRQYKGSFHHLLQDVAPQLLCQYQEIVREPTELDLLTRLVLDVTTNKATTTATSASNSLWKDQLLQLIEPDLFRNHQGAHQPDDGGKCVGIRGELELVAFLKEQSRATSLGETTNDSTANNTRKKNNTTVLSNVLVKSPNKHWRQIKSMSGSKQLPLYAIFSNVNLDGRTSEFDAMVVEKVEVNSKIKIRIVEVWEAKASLQPMTISDCLLKKYGALQAILNDPEAQFYFNKSNQEVSDFLCGDVSDADISSRNKASTYSLVSSAEESTTTIINDYDNTRSRECTFVKTLPRMGIFGFELLSPEASARRIQIVHCEALLDKSPEAVVRGLETGSVQAPDVRPYLQNLLEETRRLQPLLIVPMEPAESS